MFMGVVLDNCNVMFLINVLDCGEKGPDGGLLKKKQRKKEQKEIVLMFSMLLAFVLCAAC